MNITVNVDEISLATIVGDVVAWNEDGEEYPVGDGKTVANLVADQITARIVQDGQWPTMREKFLEIRTEEIRTAIRPQIEQAIATPIRQTNRYGEPAGSETTLRELIVEEARKALTASADSRGYGNSQTFIQKTVADEVQKALAAEIRDAVKAARDQVAGEIGEHVAAAVKAGLRK